MDVWTMYKWIQYSCLTLLIFLRHSFSLNDIDYLTKYGYIKSSDTRTGNLISEEYMKKAVSKFQRMAGLPITGIMDGETKRTMLLPRCGVKDPIGTGNRARRKKRYALHDGRKWTKQDISYRIIQYSKRLPEREVQHQLQKAFDIWSEVIPLRFKRHDYGPVDIEIKFVSGHHGDNTPFDGNGQTLAHAYFPQYGGDAHFDEDEVWTANVPDGVNLFQVAAHEFGHSLGLAHSDIRTALMAPFYRGYDSDFKLDQDDKAGAQELYGTKYRHEFTTKKHIPVVRATLSPKLNIPSICRNATVDAFTRTDDGLSYIFKGEYYYRLNDKGFDTGYPRLISWDWGSVPGPIDAALTWPNGWTFIFRGSSYWKFHNLQMIYGPKNISEGFDGIPRDIDAAFVWSGNGKTYFIKGNKYWRYYGNKIDYGYPRDLRIWNGLPERVTAAFQWQNGRTYFISGDQYYRYNDTNFNVDSGGYPRDVAVWWLGCPDKSQIIAFDREQAIKKGNNPFNTLSGKNRNDDEQWITIQDPGYVRNSMQRPGYRNEQSDPHSGVGHQVPFYATPSCVTYVYIIVYFYVISLRFKR